MKLGIIEKLKNHSKKAIVTLGLVGLVATVAIKDNVHFGSVTLHDPQENHYAIGLIPTINIKGEANGNMRSYGLIMGNNSLGDGSSLTGDMSAYGLFGGNNSLGDGSSLTGDMSAYGLFGGNNSLGDGSSLTGDIISKGMKANTPMSANFGSNVEIGLSGYIHKTETNKE